MDTLFDFEDQPQEVQGKPLKDWAGKEIPIKKPIESDNPMVRAYDRGPEGKRCKECEHLIKFYYHGKNYLKCEKKGITHGAATDIRAKWEACSKFEQARPEVKEPEKPNEPFTEVCPECKGEITLLYKHGVWSCSTCKIKIRQSREKGIVSIEPLATFGISPLEIERRV